MIKDHMRIETVVDVAEVGMLVLNVDAGGGYSLRAHPEGGDASSRDLLAVGVKHADGIVAIYPGGLSATESERGAQHPKRS